MKRAFLILAAIFALAALGAAQSGAFNFQGRLNDGTSPANGKYDLEFRLYGAETGGNQIGYTISKPATTIINGIYSTQLNFEILQNISAFYYDSDPKFIEVSVRPTAANGTTPNALTILGPRQQILFVPYAIRSLKAAYADNSTSSTYARLADNADNTSKLGGVDAARFVQQDTSGNVVISGNLTASSNFSVAGNTGISGNITQPLSANGLPKAILRVDRDGNIVRCYNGITGVSTGGCGFSVSHTFIGSYDISLSTQFTSTSLLVINVTTDFDEGNTVGLVQYRSAFSFGVGVRYISNNNATNAGLSIVIY